MRIISLEAPLGAVSLYGSAPHRGPDFHVTSNVPPSQAEVLVFFDSRGISGQWENSLLQLVLDHFGDRPYLAIARPLTMTTWATLYNVLAINDVSPDLIVTNVGFVDCTPKKRSLCEDVLDQVRFKFPSTASRLRPLEKYLLSSGATEDLFTLDYSHEYQRALQGIATARRTIAIKSPLVSPGLVLERTRPASFYAQLHAGNILVDAVGCQTIELGEFDASLTYDAVHWTPKANRLIFDKLRDVL